MPSDTGALQRWAIIIPLVIAALSFAWGVYQYFRGEQAKQEQLERERSAEADRRRIEATRPFLELQLQLYTDASKSAAVIATSDGAQEVAKARGRFKELFWGELALVEDPPVEAAMVRFQRALENGGSRADLQQLSLQLAHACRESLAKSWGTPAWQSHYRHAADEAAQ
jgi:hypothetical protein